MFAFEAAPAKSANSHTILTSFTLLVHCGIHRKNSVEESDGQNCPRSPGEAAPHHSPSGRGGMLLSSHGTFNSQEPHFELPEKQQGALED